MPANPPAPRPTDQGETLLTLLRQSLDGLIPPDVARLLDWWEAPR